MAVQKRVRNGKTRWVARYRDPAGKEHSKTFDLHREAKAWLNDRERELRAGDWINPTDGQIPLTEYWKTYKTTAQSPGTREVRKTIHANLGDMADMPIDSIRPTHVRTWLGHLTNGRPWLENKALSQNTVSSWAAQLSGCFTMAVEDGLIRNNPVSKVKKPPRKVVVTVADLPSVDDVRAAIKLADKTGRETLATMMILALGTGMRAGEVGGLTRANIDMGNKLLHVVQQTRPRSGGVMAPHFAPLKTESSRRTIPFSATVARRMAAHLLAHPDGDDEPVFRTPTGLMVTSQSISHSMKVLCGFNFHALRHLYATALIRSGQNVKAVQTMLGHASADVTLSVYTHFWPDDVELVRAAAGELVDGVVRDGCGTGKKSG